MPIGAANAILALAIHGVGQDAHNLIFTLAGLVGEAKGQAHAVAGFQVIFHRETVAQRRGISDPNSCRSGSRDA